MERTDDLSRDRDRMHAKASESSGPGPRLMGADTLLGNGVCDVAGEALGEVWEIMLDMQSGRVAYAVLAVGGVLGVGQKPFAVPWSALALDTTNHRFTLDVTRERLERSPGFDRDRWPDRADETWAGGRRWHGTPRPPAPSADGAKQSDDRIATNHTGLTPDSMPID